MTEILNISIYHYLFVAIILFATGLLGIIFSKNMFKILIATEIMFSGIIINFITFSSYGSSDIIKGGIFALFIIILTTLQIGIGITLIINIFKFKKYADTDNIGELKG